MSICTRPEEYDGDDGDDGIIVAYESNSTPAWDGIVDKYPTCTVVIKEKKAKIIDKAACIYIWRTYNYTIHRDQLVIIGAASLLEKKLNVIIIFMAKLSLNFWYCENSRKAKTKT